MLTLADRLDPRRFTFAQMQAAFWRISLTRFAAERFGCTAEDGQLNSRAAAWIEFERALGQIQDANSDT